MRGLAFIGGVCLSESRKFLLINLSNGNQDWLRQITWSHPNFQDQYGLYAIKLTGSGVDSEYTFHEDSVRALYYFTQM